MVGIATEGMRVAMERVVVGGATAEALTTWGRDCSIGVHGQIPKIIEDVPCRR